MHSSASNESIHTSNGLIDSYNGSIDEPIESIDETIYATMEIQNLNLCHNGGRRHLMG